MSPLAPQIDAFHTHLGRVSSGPRRIRACSTTRCTVLAGPSQLLSLQAFTSNTVLLPTFPGVLTVYEPRYLSMFDNLMAQSPERDGRGSRFLHILSPSVAPTAMVPDIPSLAGLPQVGCCAIVESITSQSDGTLAVSYRGDRRVSLRLVNDDGTGVAPTVIAEWFDDRGSDPSSSAAVDAAEQDLYALIKYVQKLSLLVDPANSYLPEAIGRYRPPAPRSSRPTSYDALKASGHRAATAIDIWRRHGSVYPSQRAPRQLHADPYTQVAEELGKSRRQEFFSFAAAQLLQLGIPERAALLLSTDTVGRLQFVLESVRPYLAEVAAKASVKGALGR